MIHVVPAISWVAQRCKRRDGSLSADGATPRDNGDDETPWRTPGVAWKVFSTPVCSYGKWDTLTGICDGTCTLFEIYRLHNPGIFFAP